MDGQFFKEMSLTVDKDLFAAMMQLYLEQPSEYIAPRAKEEFAKFKNYKAWADDLYSKSIFANQQKVKELLNTDPRKLFEALDTDLGAQLVLAISNLYDNEVAPQLNKIQTSINQLQRLYMKAQMEVFTGKTFYPDANSTLRVAFGNVNGYSSPTGKKYEYYTYLDGVMEKYKPGDYEFDVPEKLRDLYKKKDYGKYGANGKMPVCFSIQSYHGRQQR